MTTPRTLISFPKVVAEISGVAALEVGARSAWAHMASGERIKVARDAFTPAELSEQGNGLAFRAREVVQQLNHRSE